MDKISVIVPVYNVEPYLRRCIDSIINQTYNNLEILLINDGSTDNSGVICDEYANCDTRVKVFHQLNEGLSSARNIGLSNSTGNYIGFVDSDDWCEPYMYETLHNKMKSTDATIGITNFFVDSDGNSSAQKCNYLPDLITQTDLLVLPFETGYRGFMGVVWNKMFRAELLKNIIFEPDLRNNRDTLFYIRAVTEVSNCIGVYIETPLYHYCKREDSISQSTPIKDKVDSLIARHRIVDLLITKKFSEEVIMKFKRFHCFTAGDFAREALTKGDTEGYAVMRKQINVYLKEYIEININTYPERVKWINNILEGKINREEFLL